MEEKKGFLSRLISSDTILIALITLIGYLAVFSFEIGYFNYFKIPIQLIYFDLSHMVYLLSNIGMPIFFILIFIIIFFILIRRELKQKFIVKWGAILIFLSFLSLPIIGFLTENSGLLMVYLLLCFMLYATPFLLFTVDWFVINRRYKVIYKDYLKNSFKNFFVIERIDGLLTPDSDLINKRAEVKIRDNNIYFLLGIIYIGFFMINILFNFGMYSARRSTDFLIYKSSSECAIVYYISKETAICAPFNEITKEFESSFQFLAINDNKSFELKSIGPLHLKPTPTKAPLPTPTSIPTETPTAIPTITATP